MQCMSLGLDFPLTLHPSDLNHLSWQRQGPVFLVNLTLVDLTPFFLFHLLIPPFFQVLNEGHQLQTRFSKRILHFRRYLMVDFPYDQIVLLQLPQRLRKHLGGDVGHGPTQLSVTQRFLFVQVPEYSAFVLATYAVKGVIDGAGGDLRTFFYFFIHFILLIFNNTFLLVSSILKSTYLPQSYT